MKNYTVIIKKTDSIVSKEVDSISEVENDLPAFVYGFVNTTLGNPANTELKININNDLYYFKGNN